MQTSLAFLFVVYAVAGITATGIPLGLTDDRAVRSIPGDVAHCFFLNM